MKVRLLTTYAGPAGAASRGAVLELSAAEATGLIEGGYAVPAGGPPAARREQATTEADELRVPSFLRGPASRKPGT